LIEDGLLRRLSWLAVLVLFVLILTDGFASSLALLVFNVAFVGFNVFLVVLFPLLARLNQVVFATRLAILLLGNLLGAVFLRPSRRDLSARDIEFASSESRGQPLE